MNNAGNIYVSHYSHFSKKEGKRKHILRCLNFSKYMCCVKFYLTLLNLRLLRRNLLEKIIYNFVNIACSSLVVICLLRYKYVLMYDILKLATFKIIIFVLVTKHFISHNSSTTLGFSKTLYLTLLLI